MKKILSIIILIVLLVIVVMMLFGVKKQQDVVTNISEQEQVRNQQTLDERQTVTVKHQYKNNEHLYIGTIDLPSPCHGLEYEVTQDNAANTATIAFTTIEPATDVQCAQVIAPTPFSITIPAKEDAEVFITVDGLLVNINQFDVPPAQDINTVDILIKG